MSAKDRQFIRVLDPVRLTVRWTGDWPPPQEMVLVIGSMTGQVVLTENEPQHSEQFAQLVADGSAVMVVKRGDTSRIPDDEAEEATHVARGAEYSYDRDWAVEVPHPQ